MPIQSAVSKSHRTLRAHASGSLHLSWKGRPCIRTRACPRILQTDKERDGARDKDHRRAPRRGRRAPLLGPFGLMDDTQLRASGARLHTAPTASRLAGKLWVIAMPLLHEPLRGPCARCIHILRSVLLPGDRDRPQRRAARARAQCARGLSGGRLRQVDVLLEHRRPGVHRLWLRGGRGGAGRRGACERPTTPLRCTDDLRTHRAARASATMRQGEHHSARSANFAPWPPPATSGQIAPSPDHLMRCARRGPNSTRPVHVERRIPAASSPAILDRSSETAAQASLGSSAVWPDGAAARRHTEECDDGRARCEERPW